MNKKQIGNFVIAGLILVGVALVCFFAFYKGNQKKSVASAKTFADVYSVDKPSDAYRTLSLDQVNELLGKGKTQVLIATCRFCPHCQQYEPIVAQVIKDSLGGDRDKIQRWEAGYKCYPKQNDPAYDLYSKLTSSILGEQGVPQTILIKDGRVADREIGAIDATALRAFLTKHGVLAE